MNIKECNCGAGLYGIHRRWCAAVDPKQVAPPNKLYGWYLRIADWLWCKYYRV